MYMSLAKDEELYYVFVDLSVSTHNTHVKVFQTDIR